MIGEFVLQTEQMVRSRDQWKSLLGHVSILLATQLLVLLPFLSWGVVVVVAGIGISHGLIDYVKMRLDKAYQHTLRLFFLDQTAHATVLVAAWLVLVDRFSPHTTSFFSEFDLRTITRAGVLMAAYAFNWNGGAAVVKGVLELCHLDLDRGRENDDGEATVRGTGQVIGVLERMIVLTLVLLGEWGTIGLVLAAKSIARFKELEKRHFSEYYLIGTLSSILLAMGSGLLAKLFV